LPQGAGPNVQSLGRLGGRQIFRLFGHAGHDHIEFSVTSAVQTSLAKTS
jgi:hypothetical protein